MADLIDRDAVAYKVKSCITIPADSEWDSGYNTAMAEAKQYIQNAPCVNRWIPCSKRLPKNRERVLVCFRSGTVHIAVWYGDYDEKGAWKVTSQFPTKLYRTGTIPKWMSLPESPKGGTEDGD